MKRLVHLDAYHDIKHAREESKDFDKELAEYERLLEESDNMDGDFKKLLSYILKNVRAESSEKQKEVDDDSVHDVDCEKREEEDDGCEHDNDCEKRKGDDDCEHDNDCEKQKEEDDDFEHDSDCYDDEEEEEEGPHHEFEPPEKRRKRENDVCEHDTDCYDDDDDDDDDNDPQYELFLKSLRKHEKSYALEYEKNGKWVVLNYEEDSSSDDECDPEPRRKLRSATKQNNAPSCHMPAVENRSKNDSESTSTEDTVNFNRRKLRNKAKSETKQNVKCSTNEMVPDPDYLAFTQALKIVGGHYVYTYGGHTVVYEMKNGETNQEKKEHRDDLSSDVEIIDSTTFYKEGNVNRSMMNEDNVAVLSEFRRQVITLLRKPFDKEEYDKLRSDVKLRKQKMRHMDLRNGRERSCSARKMGKSYLDYYPGLRRRLAQFKDDKPKCLNILRGFFFWLQNSVQKESFLPWQDAECLAINPEPR